MIDLSLQIPVVCSVTFIMSFYESRNDYGGVALRGTLLTPAFHLEYSNIKSAQTSNRMTKNRSCVSLTLPRIAF